jgi:hypothetical protein
LAPEGTTKRCTYAGARSAGLPYAVNKARPCKECPAP